ncbi:Protein mab-21-like 3 [Amphibalanus amphitrite]|uniref:Protein mab-21-like 3 n=1 Tax=Amphibalanus amphitrite TaxID=1232801 RepID=A0A6A4XDQ2_AMPAM|nr:Protein mab-21-like 3 [Amphibalanus amphitrite]
MLELNVSAAPLAAAAESGAAEPCLALSTVPGFYRLLLGWSAECRHPQRRELPAAAVRAAMTEAVRRHRPGAEPRVSGPAVTFDDGGDIDCVPCVPVRCDAAVPWLAELRARPRPAGWPEDEVLARLAGPLHLVPVGPSTADRRLWRLSFSGPEALLMDALPAPARYCLMLLRLVRARNRLRLATVSSYYLKTCVFWLCQRRPEADWQEPLAAIRAVLAMLEEAIDEGFLPCFFWSEMNVIREPTPQRLAALRRTVHYFQQDLVPELSIIFRRAAPTRRHS